MTRFHALGTLGLASLLITLPTVYSFEKKAHYRNFRVVEPQILYRSGRMTVDGLDRMIREFRIATVVTFRLYADGDPNPDPAEEEYCTARGIRYLKIATRKWSAEDGGPPPAAESVRQFLALMDRRAEFGPILVHCLAGKHRTGAFVAIYRMEYQGWTNAEALAEMREIGYDNIDSEEDVRGYLERYVPRGIRTIR